MKRNNICRALVAVITVSLLLTGCKGNAAKTTDPSDALLATETTAATTATKPTTKSTTKPTTKPTTGKTETTKATESTKPAASEPAATQKPSESPKPTNPPATEAPKPTNPPATNPPATNPPATEAPKPTDPPETEPPVVSLSCSEAIEYGRSYISSLGAILTPGLSNEYCGYYPAGYVIAETQDDLNWAVVSAIDNDLQLLKSKNERMGDEFNVANYRLDVYVESDGDNGYYITVYYG